MTIFLPPTARLLRLSTLAPLALACLLTACPAGEEDDDTAGDDVGTEADTGSDETGDGELEALVELCEQQCAAAGECFEMTDLDECLAECDEYLSTPPSAECLPLEVDVLECLVGLSCEQLGMGESPDFPCLAEIEAACSR